MISMGEVDDGCGGDEVDDGNEDDCLL